MIPPVVNVASVVQRLLLAPCASRWSALPWLAFIICHYGASMSLAQERIAISGDRLSGFVLPIEPIAADLSLSASQALAWTVDDTKRLLLERDVRITLGRYDFSADAAVVWINRLPSAAGVINQVAIYFDQVRDSGKQAGLGARGRHVLVTASARGDVRLNVALMREGSPARRGLVLEGERRLAEHLQRLLASPPLLQGRPQVDSQSPRDDAYVPQPGEPVREAQEPLPTHVNLPSGRAGRLWLADPTATVRFSADHVELKSGKVENTITAIGSIVIETAPRHSGADDPHLILSAERAVLFTDPGELRDLAAGQLDAADVRGVYLEGNVSATTGDGQYAVRAPRVYYDFRTRQAIMLDPLLRLHTRDTPIPVYARAQEVRQLAENQWQARNVRVSTSEFATPHLSIGADEMTITQRPRAHDPDQTEVFLESRGNVLGLEGIPIVPWPNFKGNVDDVPLRGVQLGSNKADGIRVLTTWDLYTLLGRERPRGVEADLRLDGFTERGGGGGVEFRYDIEGSQGIIDLYGLHDDGEDRTSSGRTVDPDREWRGVALAEHQTRLSDAWLIQLQGSFISDETFMTAWREDDFTERREFETSAYLKHQQEHSALTLLAKYQVQDFLSNDYVLASRQYSVDKAPELTYRRYGDSLFDLFTYSMENRVSRMRLAFQRTTGREIGVRPGAFGFDPDLEIDDVLRSRGLQSKWINRFDSRHELAMPTQLGPVTLTPFVVGRFTGYDDDFETFSSDSDSMRFFGAGGLRLHTQMHRVDNTVENQTFDLHRMRHIIEPYAMLWHGEAGVEQQDYPEYDPEVESLAEGSLVQVGLRNTWQTQRGGPGRWRSVDWITLDTSVVYDSEGEPEESPTPHFFDYRPEYSQFGDHARAELIWLLSDTLTLAGETTYALEPDVFARSSVGMELRHSPVFTTYVEYRFIDASDNELLGANWTYQLTPKYALSLRPQWDFNEDDFRSLTARLTRRFPDFDFTLAVRYDKIRDETSLGASLGAAEF